MKLQINGQHIVVTEPMKKHIVSKLKSLDTYFTDSAAAHVMVKVEKRRHVVEISVVMAGASFFAEAHSNDMYIATEMVVDKLGRQLAKYKEKRTSHHEDEVFHHEPVTRARLR